MNDKRKSRLIRNVLVDKENGVVLADKQELIDGDLYWLLWRPRRGEKKILVSDYRTIEACNLVPTQIKLYKATKTIFDWMWLSLYQLPKSPLHGVRSHIRSLLGLEPISTPLSYFLKIFICLLYPVVRIRYGPIFVHRIGHLAYEFKKALSEKQHKRWKFYHLVLWSFTAEQIEWCNSQLEIMVRREFLVVRWNGMWSKGDNVLLRKLLCYRQPPSLSHDGNTLMSRVDAAEIGFRDHAGTTALVKAPSFTPDEDAIGRAFLASLDISDPKKIIGINVRNPVYYKWLFGGSDNTDQEWRNMDIQLFEQGILLLIRRGYTVIRFGKKEGQQFSESLLQQKRLVDYAMLEDRSDLLDIWLMSKISGFVTNSTGLLYVADLFSKPCLNVNVPRPAGWSPWCNMIVAPIGLIENRTQRPLSFSEQIAIHGATGETYKKAGLSFKNLTPDEIALSLDEFCDVLERSWEDTTEDSEMEREVRELYQRWCIKAFGQRCWLHPGFRIAPWYLRKNYEWYVK